MKTYIKKTAIYALVMTMLVSGINVMPTVSVSAEEFNGDIASNPWGDKFIDDNKDPGDITIPGGGTGGNSGNGGSTGSGTTSTSSTSGNNGDGKTTETTNNDTVASLKKALKTKVVSAKKTSKKSTKAKIQLKKVKQAAGYQVKYSTSKKFKKSKTKTKKTTKTKFTIKKLKKNKTYYIKARAYGKVNGKTVYGSWSTKKKIK